MNPKTLSLTTTIPKTLIQTKVQQLSAAREVPNQATAGTADSSVKQAKANLITKIITQNYFYLLQKDKK